MKKWSLIITIVRKGWGDKVLEASMKAGAEGGTIFMGRGTWGARAAEITGYSYRTGKGDCFLRGSS